MLSLPSVSSVTPRWPGAGKRTLPHQYLSLMVVPAAEPPESPPCRVLLPAYVGPPDDRLTMEQYSRWRSLWSPADSASAVTPVVPFRPRFPCFLMAVPTAQTVIPAIVGYPASHPAAVAMHGSPAACSTRYPPDALSAWISTSRHPFCQAPLPIATATLHGSKHARQRR